MGSYYSGVSLTAGVKFKNLTILPHSQNIKLSWLKKFTILTTLLKFCWEEPSEMGTLLGACPRITLFGKIRALQITQSTAETDVSLKI